MTAPLTEAIDAFEKRIEGIDYGEVSVGVYLALDLIALARKGLRAEQLEEERSKLLKMLFDLGVAYAPFDLPVCMGEAMIFATPPATEGEDREVAPTPQQQGQSTSEARQDLGTSQTHCAETKIEVRGWCEACELPLAECQHGPCKCCGRPESDHGHGARVSIRHDFVPPITPPSISELVERLRAWPEDRPALSDSTINLVLEAADALEGSIAAEGAAARIISDQRSEIKALYESCNEQSETIAALRAENKSLQEDVENMTFSNLETKALRSQLDRVVGALEPLRAFAYANRVALSQGTSIPIPSRLLSQLLRLDARQGEKG